jgi:hypothetical protein
MKTLFIQEQMDILFKPEPLGGRKPSQMLANMLAYCPSGMEQQSIMFQYMFLLRLRVTLLTLLGEQQEPVDIRSLAARAEKPLTSMQQFLDLVANQCGSG